ncbi:hypothetical protein AYK26_05060 [Euryarchaeota archaeon SM23-78]|nr:MAG: hypothetical protein AYK26_05060 [Euryarchaeota archaeon SM23-78]
MKKFVILICLLLIVGILSGCGLHKAQGGPVKYGECGDGICDHGENTSSYPYYCPQDCQSEQTEVAINN